MTKSRWALVTIGVLLVAVGCTGQAGFFAGTEPADLGVRDGRLKAPSNTDNSVTSQAALFPDSPQREAAAIAPLALRGSGLATIARIAAIVEGTDGAKLIRSGPDYLYAQYTSRVMRFVDDVEFWYDPQTQVVQVRSASRLGKSDLGVNRRRIESIRTALAARP